MHPFSAPARAPGVQAHGAERLLVGFTVGPILGGGGALGLGGRLPAPLGGELDAARLALLELGGFEGMCGAPRLFAAVANELAKRLVLRDLRRLTPVAFTLQGGVGRVGRDREPSLPGRHHLGSADAKWA